MLVYEKVNHWIAKNIKMFLKFLLLMSWSIFKKFFVYLHPLKVSLDTSKIAFKDNFFQIMQSKIVRAFNDMEALEAGNITNPDEKRMVGHYWLRNFQLAPKKNINTLLHDNWLKVRAFADKILNQEIQGSHGPFKYLLCIGIGGSALGPQLLSDALDRKPKGLRALFIDNTDPDGIFRVLKKIHKHLGQTLVLVTSKSGGTPEPRNGLIEIRAAFAKQNIPFHQHAVAITCEGSLLDMEAQQEHWLARFPMWDWIGGRTSLFSNVGLVPAALQNIDISALIQGATEMDILTRNTEVLNNPAMMLALAWYACTEGTGKRNMVVLPYKDALILFPRYLQQLVMESLGKKLANDGRRVFQGLTVYGNKGSTDQHAYVQQLRDGLDDAFVVFIEVQVPCNPSNVHVEPGLNSGDFLEGFLLGTRAALAEVERPSITLTLKHLNAQSLGALVALFERAVGFYASFVRINAYNQPGVEAGKKAAVKFLNLQKRILNFLIDHTGEYFSAESLAQALNLNEDTESIFKLLEYLAANKKIFRNKLLPLTQSTYCLRKK
jgi:glucose-6-phosphate isomerase